MLKDRLFFLISLAGLGLLVAFLFRSPQSAPLVEGGNAKKQLEVMVAKQKLIAGSKLTGEEYDWKVIEPEKYEPTLIARDENVENWLIEATVVKNVDEGEPVKRLDISWPQEKTEQKWHMLPAEPGKRGVPFSLSNNPSFIQFINPGMYVDVIFTSKPDLGFGSVSITLLKDVRVLSVGAGIDENESSSQVSKNATILLEMSSREAEILSYATNSGIITFSLSEERPDRYAYSELTDLLNNAHSAGNFDSILVTHMIRTLFPGVDVQIIANTRGYIASGTVHDPQIAAKIREILFKISLGGEKTVVDLLKVEPQQVLLCVKVMEVDRDTIMHLGINWEAVWQKGMESLTLAAVFPRPAPNTANYMLNLDKIQAGDWTFSAIVDLLQQRGCAKILAEPNITTISGESGYFFAGGEFPILIPQGGNLIGTVTVEYKKFGVILDVTPYVDLNGLITLHVVPEVSAIDRQNDVVISGFVIPALTTRKAETTVKLWPGQCYAIAGLMQYDRLARVFSLCNLDQLPIIGPLFRSKEFRTRKTELMILITPYILYSGDKGSYTEQLTEPPCAFTCPPSEQPSTICSRPGKKYHAATSASKFNRNRNRGIRR